VTGALLAVAALISPPPDATGARLAEIQRVLDAEQGNARVWWWFWTLGFAAAAVSGAALSQVVDDPSQSDGFAVGAVGATIGFTSMLVIPFPAKHAADDVRALEGDPESRLDAAERIFEDAAQREAFGEGWLAHVGGLVVGTGLATYLWKVRGHPDAALRNFAMSLAAGQAKIHTQPDHLPEAFDTYRARWPEPPPPTPLFGMTLRF
jgi:hypothetical protein